MYKFIIKINIVITSSTLLILLLNCNLIKCTKRPIIGVLVQEFTPNDTFVEDKNATGFIVATYIQAIESSGARVVPIFIRQNDSYYEWIMNSINGILLPGGAVEAQPGYPYYDASKIIFKIATQMNDKGISFPILGICLGFQAMLIIYNNDIDLLMQCDSIYESLTLEFMPNFTKSQLFSPIDQTTLIMLKHFPTTVNNHVYCVLPTNFTGSNLVKDWRITSCSKTKKGLKFIATVEHAKYPFIGLQFHPEMAAFNWAEDFDIPHDLVTIRANRYFYDLFVNKSKTNDNKFENREEERKTLIYNYNPIYRRVEPHQYYSQRYIFYN